jgi:sugar O-acyltransferase (sialic acid O-acetyltransferase NeuD family)
MKNIIIIGAGGFAREVAWLIEDINKENSEWNFIGYIEEFVDNIGKELNGAKILGTFEWIKQNTHKELYYVCAVGDPCLKEKFNQMAQELGLCPATLVHPSVMMSKYNNIREGSIICAGCIITVNVKIGKHVIVNIDCTIGHDSIIGDYSTILPSVNVSGNVNMGIKCNIGTGASIMPKVKIGYSAIIGAGAVVVKDIPNNSIAVGIPAKVIKCNNFL